MLNELIAAFNKYTEALQNGNQNQILLAYATLSDLLQLSIKFSGWSE
jgi:hypothetical protein